MDIQLFSRVSFMDKLLFTKHLSMMLTSGIPIIEALVVLASQTKSKKFRGMIENIYKAIQNGQSLAAALKKYPHVFDVFYVNMIKIGEDSGTLDESLSYLTDQLTKEYAFRKKVQGALMYPTIVLVAAVGIGFGISLFVLPKLLDLFQGFDVTLPFTTQLLLSFAMIMRDYGIFVFIGFIFMLIFLHWIVSVSIIKPFWHQFLLRIPIFGNLLQQASLASLCRNLGIMMKSGVPINTALQTQTQITTNVVYQNYVKKLSLAIDRGTSLTKELEKNYSLIPLIMVKMISVGEQTGKLEESFLYLGDFFEEEVDDATKNISTILEPVLLIFVGLIVAFVALSVISPIYELTASIKR